MSLCAPCTRLKQISVCTDSIVIGTVSSINTVYHIYFVSLANGMRIRYTATSDANGLLTLTPADGFILATNHLYEIFVTTGTSVTTGDNLTIGSTTTTCYQLSFVDALHYPFISQTLEIA